MTGKLSLLLGLAVGYVLGTRAGRDRYEKIASKAHEVWQDPRVQQKAGQAQRLLKNKAGDASSKIAEQANQASSKVAGTASGSIGDPAGVGSVDGADR